MDRTEGEYCIVHCRVSSTKQSQEGESLAVQAGICVNIATSHGWPLAHKPWLESFSGRKNNRPIFEEVLDFIDAHPGMVRRYLFRSIDRFTRGGTYTYETMKRELSKRGVEMVDSYGIIQPSTNTLKDLDIEYDWSKYYPSEITESVMATTAKQEVTHILTRMIGQSIRNTRQGYRSRRPADGYKNEKVFVDGKKKVIQVPNSERAKFYVAMFELRAQGQLTDPQIVERLNAMGFRSEIQNRYNKEHTKIIGNIGGKPLNVKQFQRIIQNTIYAGVLCEKWTKYLPIKAQYPGLVSIEAYNRANRGNPAIMQGEDDTLYMVRGESKTGSHRSRNNPLFPFKFFLCPFCNKPFTASATRGKLGKKHPTYHCSRNHKYYGVTKKNFEDAVTAYTNSLEFNPDVLNGLEVSFLNKYRHREKEIVRASGNINIHVGELKLQQASKLEAFEATKSAVVREKLEQDIDALEEKIKKSRKERSKIEITEADIKLFIAHAKYIMEHPAEILLKQRDIRVQRELFGLVFEKMPTYAEIVSGTPKLSFVFNLSSTFAPNKNQLVSPVYLDWNTLETMVLKWKNVFAMIEPEYSASVLRL
jgi:DNA invertase Pin-like site-specific DNA recombinase